MLRIAHLRFAPSNPFARSLRSLGVLVPAPDHQNNRPGLAALNFGTQGGNRTPTSEET